MPVPVTPTNGTNPGQITVDPSSHLPDLIPGSIRAVRVSGARGSEMTTLLPHIRPLGDSWREGPESHNGDFEYVFDDTRPIGEWPYPKRFEEIFGLDKTGPNIIQIDDRIATIMDRVDGSVAWLFDGFAQSIMPSVSGGSERVAIGAMGLPVREWDYPLTGALMRDSHRPNDGSSNVKTDTERARFNPDGKPNATPFLDDGSGGNLADTIVPVTGGNSPPFPVFMEADYDRIDPVSGQETYARKWTLGMAARYILMGNPNQEYTRRPDFALLDAALKARAPIAPATTYDPHKPSTYTASDIFAHDLDVTGMPWPEALAALIEPHGFGMTFRLETTDAGLPDWWLDIYRKDEPVTIETPVLQPAGSIYDGTKSNVAKIELVRDGRSIINEFAVDSQAIRKQATFILAPGFAYSPSDATTPNAFTSDEEAAGPYRDFIFNEDGATGFFNGAWHYTAPDLTALLTHDSDGNAENGLQDPLDPRKYVVRRRKPLKTLFSKGADGKRQTASLNILIGYTGTVPGLFNPLAGSFTSRSVQDGGWELLDDRIGIRLVTRDPNDWNIGKSAGATYFRDGRVRVVECIAAPDPTKGKPYIVFALTCVIEGDRGVNAWAKRRPATPTSKTIYRRDDARDRYKAWDIFPSIAYAGTAQRNDVAEAVAHAEGRRAMFEKAKFGGTITVNRPITWAWIGDKIDKIAGREVSLRTTVAATQAEGSQYPSIVGVDRTYNSGGFSTIIQLDDRRAEQVRAGNEGTLAAEED